MTSPGYLMDCELTVIDVTNGADQDVWLDVEDRRRNNITTVEIALGTFDAPGAWHPADQVEQNGAVWQIRAGLRIGGSLTYPLAVYWGWTRTTTVESEVFVERADNRLIEIT
jgi:hypothetical protein